MVRVVYAYVEWKQSQEKEEGRDGDVQVQTSVGGLAHLSPG